MTAQNDIVICYDASRSEILTALKEFYHGIITVPDNYQESQSRQLNQTYQEKLISKVLFHYGNKLLFPYPLRAGITVIKSVKYIYEGIHTLAQGKIEVPVLDGNGNRSIDHSKRYQYRILYHVFTRNRRNSRRMDT